MSFWRNYYHLVWATKNRKPLIEAAFEKRLYAYMVKKAAELGAFVYIINGTENHIHIILSIPPKTSVADLVKLIKGASSHYINHVICPTEKFTWQRGYGCLTIGEKQRPIAENYVAKQKEHHAEEKTNAWLERYTEEDEGPMDRIAKENLDNFIREEKAEYGTLGKFPF